VVEYKAWVCLKCEKEWKVANDLAYPSLKCDCGSTDFISKLLYEKLPGA